MIIITISYVTGTEKIPGEKIGLWAYQLRLNKGNNSVWVLKK